MNTVKNLLPVGATTLEKRAAECLRQAVKNQIVIADLINPMRCPEPLLPYLAWAFSVDRWEEDWAETVKRQAIIDSYVVHKRKGTVSAVRRIVESLGYQFEIREWFNEKRWREAGTFRLFVELKETGIDLAIYDELARLVEDAKPVSRHITELAIVATQKAPMHIFSATQSGEISTIYPSTL